MGKCLIFEDWSLLFTQGPVGIALRKRWFGYQLGQLRNLGVSAWLKHGEPPLILHLLLDGAEYTDVQTICKPLFSIFLSTVEISRQTGEKRDEQLHRQTAHSQSP